MSNPDSFIAEVNEEVRRDRLYAAFRRYGWIGVVAVLALVGAAAWYEWQRAGHESRSERFGDALLAALEAPTPAERRAALAAVPATGQQVALRDLMLASDPADDKAATLAALQTVAEDAALPVSYRDLASLRRVIVAGPDLPAADRRAVLDQLAVPGRPFRVLAVEQLAYLDIEEGARDQAIERLTALTQDQEATPALQRRAAQIIEALGGARATG